jgi:hypothetical protein
MKMKKALSSNVHPLDPERLERMYHLDHPRPRTRRQFLAQGFIAGAAVVTSPSLYGLLGRGGGDAYAQAVACQLTAGGAGRIPFICIDLAGGASIAGSNVLVGRQGGHQTLLDLEGYSKLGLPADMTPDVSVTDVVDLRLGLPFHTGSAFLAGIIDKTTPATLANVNGAVFCARSANDTQNNPHNPMYGIGASGSTGGLLTLVGTEPSDSGGNSVAPMSMIDPTMRPTKIDRPEDATGLVDTGRLVQMLDTDGADSVMRAVENLSNRKIDKMEITEEMLVTELVRCTYQQSSQLVSLYGDSTALDPRQDPFIATGATPILSAADFGESRFRKTASVMKLVVDGHAGAGTIELGGYDYHNSTRATGERRDFEAGQCMGACLEYAAQRQEDLFLYVFSDGSVSSTGEIDADPAGNGKGIWKSDNSSTSAAFILVYG